MNNIIVNSIIHTLRPLGCFFFLQIRDAMQQLSRQWHTKHHFTRRMFPNSCKACSSVVSVLQNYTTYLFRTNIVMEYKGYVWRCLQKCLPEEVTEKVVGMRLTKDRMVRNYVIQGCRCFHVDQTRSIFFIILFNKMYMCLMF